MTARPESPHRRDPTYPVVLDLLGRGESFVLTTHEHPDGDALGSLAAMLAGLERLGKDAVAFLGDHSLPLPREYEFLGLEEKLVPALPEDASERKIVFLDCGNIDRVSAEPLRANGLRILNIDHHHDNTRFGDVNLVLGEAACTAEIVFDLLVDLGIAIDRYLAEAIYCGIVTDTGRFMYQNTTAYSHRVAAELIDVGARPSVMYNRLYEGIPLGRLKLLAIALDRVKTYDGGAIAFTELLREDYDRSMTADSDAEGIIDHVRTLDGTSVAALVREVEELPESQDIVHPRKVSLRSVDDRVDVSLIARKAGGGGHRRAAGFRTELTTERLIQFLRDEVASQL